MITFNHLHMFVQSTHLRWMGKWEINSFIPMSACGAVCGLFVVLPSNAKECLHLWQNILSTSTEVKFNQTSEVLVIKAGPLCLCTG